jgi:peptide/nickel transport system permease protein
LLVALIAITVFGRGIWQAAGAVGLSLAPAYARLLRGTIITTRSQPYVRASYALGAGRWWASTRHIYRNIAPSLIQYFAIIFAWSLASITAVEFLGLGGPLETPSWGSMIAFGRAYVQESPWSVFAPGLAICLAVLGVVLLGDAKFDVPEVK